MVKGCENQNRDHANFDHVNLDRTYLGGTEDEGDPVPADVEDRPLLD